jgi:hypothetical protein
MQKRTFLPAAFLALFLAQSTVSLAQVDWIWLSKDIAFIQTSATGPTPSPSRTPCNYGCAYRMTTVVGGANVASIPAPILSGPVNTARVGSAWNGGRLHLAPGPPVDAWILGDGNFEFANTRAGLDAKFASGTYTVAAGGKSVALDIAGDAYPAPSSVSFSAGSWSNGFFVVDPRQPLTITTSRFAEYDSSGVDASIHLYVGPGPRGNIADLWQYRSSAPGTPTGFVTIPANTLVDGEQYYVGSVFETIVDQDTTAFAPSRATASYRSITNVRIKAQSQPIFPMTVNANIGTTVSSATATVTPRPQDAGSSLYVFALAPAPRVLNAVKEKGAFLGHLAKRTQKDAVAVPCVIAQLNDSGLLQAVSTSSLQAYVSGVLAGQAQAVTVLNNVATANIAGAAFFVGMGTDPTAMVRTGVNRRALGIPGEPACDPQPPQTGWWWNPAEAGRGYSIEVSGNTLVFASYLYDVTGRATWMLASGETSLDGSLFTGKRLESYSQGQTLGGAYRAPVGVAGEPITMAFNDGMHGTLSWPGGSVAIERFNIVPNGLSMTARPHQPEAGWWWNPEESGRGFFLEWQGGQLFMAGYMYDDAGNPIWYLSGDSTPAASMQSYANAWQQLGNGQTLTGTYRAPTQVSSNVAPVTIQFTGAETGIMTLPGGRTTAIRRYRF